MRSIVLGCSFFVLWPSVCMYVHAQTAGSRPIYRCEVDGVLTFSDRQCGPDGEQHELDPHTLNTFEPPPASGTSHRPASKAKKPKRSSGAAIDPAKQRQNCERLTQRLKDIRTKQRTGYKAEEGVRMKDREAKLKSQLRAARCR